MIRVAVVTGGSRGIGRAIALEAAGRGYDVAVGYWTGHTEAKEVVAQIEALGRRAVAIQADVAETEALEDLSVAGRELGPIALLVNNAGITSSGSIEAMRIEEWNRAIAVNLTAPSWLSKLLAADLRATRGAIVNIASVGGIVGSLHSVPYAATKAGLLGVTKTMARMLAPDVRVNAICPGPIATELLDNITEAQIGEILSATPAARIGVAAEIAQAVLDVSEWTYCTGQTIVIDGGRVMH